MSNDPDWIEAAISKAREQSAEVPEPLWTQIDTLLRGKLSQRPIPPVELANLARQLIEDMAPAPQELEEQQ